MLRAKVAAAATATLLAAALNEQTKTATVTTAVPGTPGTYVAAVT